MIKIPNEVVTLSFVVLLVGSYLVSHSIVVLIYLFLIMYISRMELLVKK